MLSKRMTVTVILAAVGLVLFGTHRPTSVDPLKDLRFQETWFYIHKVHSKELHDLVIVGDSRALRGVSPSVLGEAMGGINVFNFAFNAAGLTDEMFREGEARLDPDSESRSILLAVTPLAFQSWKSENAQFHEYLNKPVDEVALYTYFPSIPKFFQPVSVAVLPRRWLSLAPPVLLHPVYHPDGWIETTQEPLVTKPQVNALRRRLQGNVADSSLIDGLISQIGKWISDGIVVYGFRPPAAKGIAQVENEILKFNHRKFAERFKAAGGIWIELPERDYVFYDGSHLDGRSARAMTALLGKEMMLAHKSGIEP